MSFGDDLTFLDMMNVLKWYELIPKEIKILEQHVRTKIKFQGLFAIHEDSSEILIANLVESVSSQFSLASNTELQSCRSLLANRIARIDQEVKVMHNLIEKIDKKMGTNHA
jgi:hypothetical protein